MRAMIFASRNTKEILRDPLTICFGLGFPIVLLILLWSIGKSVPQQAEINLYTIEMLTPGISVFGLSFISLFSAQLIAKDKTTSFMMRMFTSPLKAYEFIIGYTIPLLPMALAQSAVCYITAICLGLKFSVNIIATIIINIPIAIVFIALGLLCGTLFNEKAVGGICGALLTNLTGWFSNIWFDTELVGGWFASIAECLPFAHAVNSAEFALNGGEQNLFLDLWVVIGYALVLLCVSIVLFMVKLKKDK